LNPRPPQSPWTRALPRRAFFRGALALGAGGAAIYAVGCGGGGDDSGGDSGSPTAAPKGASSRIQPALLGTEFVAGETNRFLIGLLDENNQLLKDAAVHVRFFTLGADGTTGTLRGEGDMTFVELNVEDAHAHDNSSGDLASTEATAFYVATVPFDAAGRWGAEIAVTPQQGDPATVQMPFDVLVEPNTPALGTVPPASQNDTVATNPNSEQLCSRDPICPLHDKVIGDVLGKGRPLVVQFSTPAFCQTRFCGPVLEVLLAEEPQYRDRIDFIHIEVWQDFQLQRYRPAMVEWNLKSEPYTFFMDSNGRVVAKLEAIFSEEELMAALDQLVNL
jgi:hypothetical protein